MYGWRVSTDRGRRRRRRPGPRNIISLSSPAPSVRRCRRANTSVSNRKRRVDVDDDLVRSCRSTSSSASRSAPSSPREPGLDGQGLAEDAGRLGQRHRQPPLQRRPLGERRVVVGVAELVGRGLGRVERTRPVEQHERPVVDERHAERAAVLAVAGAGVDPPLVEGTVDEPAQLGAVRRERSADDSIPSSHETRRAPAAAARAGPTT